jgi:hypothetical protein
VVEAISPQPIQLEGAGAILVVVVVVVVVVAWDTATATTLVAGATRPSSRRIKEVQTTR